MLQLKQKYALGFADDLNELSAVSLVVEGTFPNWLSGRLIKNGPAMFHAGERELAHWFDGFAKLHKFDIGSGQIRYSCRFLQSQAYQQARLKGKLVRSEFASNPELSLFERLKAIANPSLTDNTNVNVLPCGQSWLALTETSSIYSFSPESLDTIGLFKFDDNIGAQITTYTCRFRLGITIWSPLGKRGKQRTKDKSLPAYPLSSHPTYTALCRQ